MSIGKKIRNDFPIFAKHPQLHYLDSASTSQKPKAVLDAMRAYYEESNANPRRGMYGLSRGATECHEKAREKIAHFLNASAQEIVFVRNSTEALNLLSYSLGAWFGKKKPVVALSGMEHHSNFVPWQQMAGRTGGRLEFVPFNPDEKIGPANLEKMRIKRKPGLLALTHASNVLGTVNDVAGAVAYAHEEWGCPVAVDGAQAAPHLKVDVQELGADFYAFSGHKMLGPTGCSALYMKEGWVERLPPFMTGGGQIGQVNERSSTWARGPARFEAGTPDVAGAAGLAAAAGYLERIGFDEISRHEQKMERALREAVLEAGAEIYGPGEGVAKVGVVSFNLRGVHGHDVSTVLDRHGVAVRGGHHCAQPLMRRLGVEATVRASAYLYNDQDDVQALAQGLKEVRKIFG